MMNYKNISKDKKYDFLYITNDEGSFDCCYEYCSTVDDFIKILIERTHVSNGENEVVLKVYILDHPEEKKITELSGVVDRMNNPQDYKEDIIAPIPDNWKYHNDKKVSKEDIIYLGIKINELINYINNMGEKSENE